MYAVIDIGSNTIRLVLYKLVGGIPQSALSSKQAALLCVTRNADITPNDEAFEAAEGPAVLIMEVQDRDDVKARQLCADGTYRPVPGGSVPTEAQQVLMDDAVAHAPTGKGHRSILDRLRPHRRR